MKENEDQKKYTHTFTVDLINYNCGCFEKKEDTITLSNHKESVENLVCFYNKEMYIQENVFKHKEKALRKDIKDLENRNIKMGLAYFCTIVIIIFTLWI